MERFLSEKGSPPDGSLWLQTARFGLTVLGSKRPSARSGERVHADADGLINVWILLLSLSVKEVSTEALPPDTGHVTRRYCRARIRIMDRQGQCGRRGPTRIGFEAERELGVINAKSAGV